MLLTSSAVEPEPVLRPGLDGFRERFHERVSRARLQKEGSLVYRSVLRPGQPIRTYAVSPQAAQTATSVENSGGRWFRKVLHRTCIVDEEGEYVRGGSHICTIPHQVF